MTDLTFTKIEEPAAPSGAPSAAGGLTFTKIGDSEAPPAQPTAMQRLAHGFEAPFVGMDVLASQAEQHLPFVPKETAAHDLAAAEQERADFEKQGSRGFSALETIGNLANPLNYLVGGPAKGAGLAATLGRAALSGAGSAAVQPRHGPGEIAGGAAFGTLGGAAGEGIARALSGNTAAGLNKFIKENFERAIKPSVSGKSTYSQAAAYDQKVANAIESVVGNKANLRLVDDNGQVVSGKLPKTLSEFSQAIDQTKHEIFRQYDALAKAAGQKAGVPLTSEVAELNKIANSPIIGDFDPQVANYARGLARSLTRRGGYSTEEAQAAIQHLNASLQAFYKNPSYEAASKAAVDALVANKLREGLDATISNTVGPGYQELKNRYGALRTLEKDVVHRAIVVGRQELGRGFMGRVGDVVSAEEVIRGLLHFSPATIATGAGLRAFTGFVRHLHSPNRAVRRIFDAAEKKANLPSASPMRDAAAAAVRRLAPVGAASAFENMTGQMQ